MDAVNRLDLHASTLAKLAAAVLAWKAGQGMDESFAALMDHVDANESAIKEAARYFGQKV